MWDLPMCRWPVCDLHFIVAGKWKKGPGGYVYLLIGGPIDSHLPKWRLQVIRYNIDLMVTGHMHVIVIACLSYKLDIWVDYLYQGEGEVV